jgi:hypothetical protein
VLVLYLNGGQSHLDTFDPKPDAPVEVRGDFRTISTTAPGTRVCEHLPMLARLADRYTILRSVSHDDLDHGSAGYWALTGRPHARKTSNPPPRPTDHPTYGAVVRRLRPGGRLPYAAIHLNGPALVPEDVGPGQGAGFLGTGCEPLVIGDPTDESALALLGPRPDLSPPREARRRALRRELEKLSDARQDQALHDMDQWYRQAYDLLAAPDARRAFDLEREPASVRERYGRYRSGQACLLARRLVEAGVPWITVMFNRTNRGQDKNPDLTETYGWDTHNDIFEALKAHLLPRFDQTVSALLIDLQERGLLDTTLVVCMGEFGRAPRVAVERNFAGSTPGRKHWAMVYSIVLAGAGVASGAVIGASDRNGAYPSTAPVGPGDVAATLFAALGIGPEGCYTDLSGRPYRIAEGRPIASLYR